MKLAITGLRLLEDGRLECRLAGSEIFVEAELKPPATVHPYLTVMAFKAAGRGYTVLVLADSAHPDDFRRLRVWLRWRADFSVAKNAV